MAAEGPARGVSALEALWDLRGCLAITPAPLVSDGVKHAWSADSFLLQQREPCTPSLGVAWAVCPTKRPRKKKFLQ